MPEFIVKEVRLPGLHLPEIKRDEIVRTLSGIRVPEVDLAKIRPRRSLSSVAVRARPWRRPGMAGIDAGKVIAAAVMTTRIVRRASSRGRWSPVPKSRWGAVGRSRDNLIAVVRPAPKRSRGRLAIVLVVLAAAAAWLLFRNPAVRARLDRATAEARRRIDEMRAPGIQDPGLETAEPASVAVAEVEPGGAAEAVVAEGDIEATEPAADPA